jgi:hypothetical protein
MEIFTLATSAMALAIPFLQKIGEGTSTKVGEEIWNLIKGKFSRDGKKTDGKDTEQIKVDLVDALSTDSQFREELERFVVNSQKQQNTGSQNIQNVGNVSNQVNVNNNIGDITL